QRLQRQLASAPDTWIAALQSRPQRGQARAPTAGQKIFRTQIVTAARMRLRKQAGNPTREGIKNPTVGTRMVPTRSLIPELWKFPRNSTWSDFMYCQCGGFIATVEPFTDGSAPIGGLGRLSVDELKCCNGGENQNGTCDAES